MNGPWDNDQVVAVLDDPWNADPEAPAANPWDADPVAEPETPGQNPVVTTGAAFVKGLADLGPAIVGGGAKLMDKGADIVAKYTGTQKGGLFGSVAGVMDDIGEESERVYPVDPNNPIAATIGGGAAQGAGLLAGGALARGIGMANAATVPLAAGFAMGAGSGIDKAKEIGVESPEAQLAMGLLFGGTELATERLGGIGNKAATEALMNAYRQPAAELLKRAAKTMAGEGGEEMLAGTAQDIITRAFATEDPANPGFTTTGVKLPDLDREFLKDRGLDFVGGASGGAVFAGANVLANRSRPTGPEPMTSEINPVEVGPNPFAGPIEAPPQPTEAGGVVPPSPYAPPVQAPFEQAPPGLDGVPFEEAPQGLDGVPWVPPVSIEGGLTEVAQPDLTADITQGLPQAMQPEVVAAPFEEAPAGLDGVPFEEAPAALQPWDNDPIVPNDAPPTLPIQTDGDPAAAADAAGVGGGVDLAQGTNLARATAAQLAPLGVDKDVAAAQARLDAAQDGREQRLAEAALAAARSGMGPRAQKVNQARRLMVEQAIQNQESVAADAMDIYARTPINELAPDGGIQVRGMPAGYVQEGDLFVYRPEAVALEPGQARAVEDADGAVTVEIPQGEEVRIVSDELVDGAWNPATRQVVPLSPEAGGRKMRRIVDAKGNVFIEEGRSFTAHLNSGGTVEVGFDTNNKPYIAVEGTRSQLGEMGGFEQGGQFFLDVTKASRVLSSMTGQASSKVLQGLRGSAAAEQVEALSPKYAVPFAKGPLTTMHYAQLPPTATGQVWSGKIRTLHGIRKKLLSAAGLPQAGVGRFARALGIYKVKAETLRLQAINDIPVLAHELGHAIHYRELSADRTKADSWGGRYDGELMRLGQPTSTPAYTPDQVRKEGVAEFTRLWLTDTAKARAEAPRFSAFWEAELERKNPKLAMGLQEARAEIADYIAMPAFQKAKAQIAFDPTSEKVPRTIGARIRDTYAKWVNTLQPALDVVREAAVVDPTQAVRAKEVEAWMENHRGGWASKAHSDIFGNQTSLDGKRIGPGMAQILKEIEPGQAESFSTYLALKRAAEIERQGKRSGFENAKLPAAEMKVLEARFEPTRKKLLKWSNNEMQLLVDSGLLDGASAAKMRQMNEDYVPFYRIYEKLNGVSFGPEGSKQSGGYVDLNSGIRRLKGSDRAIVDPLQSLMKNAFMFRKIAEQNHIGVQFFDLLGDVQGHGKWTEQIPTRKKATVIKHEQMVRKLIDEGVIQSEADLPADADLTLRLFEAIKRPETDKGEVIVFKNGQRQHWEVKDPQLMEALKNSDGDSIKLWKFLGGTLGRALTLPTRVVRWGATGGPWFALPNFVRDQVVAGVQSRTGFIPFVDGVRGAFEVMRKGDMYQRWIESGGKYHGLTTGTQAFTDLLEDALPKEPSARRAMQSLANPRNWKKALSYAGEVLEEATRVQEFARGVRQGLPERQAANLSKTVSLNFARAGERGRALNQLIAFTNAKIQDLDLIVRSHADPTRRGQVMAKGFLFITVPSILTWWLGKDDEEIQNLPEWRKNLFWNINMGPVARVLGRESFILSIPKPFLMGAIYGTSVERALDFATGRDPNGMRKAMKNLMANGPDGLHPVEMAMSVAGLKPLIEATTNYNLFQKREIVPERMKFLPKDQQYDIHTSEVAKMVGKFTGQSPMVVDHLLRGYFATAGKFGTDAVDYGMAKLGAADVPPAPAKDIMEAPILNRFSGSPYAANAFVERFYKATQEMEGKLAVWNKQAEQMTEPAQKQFWDKNGDELRHFLRTVNYETGLTGAGQVRKAMEAMSDMNKAMKETQQSRVLSPEEKRSRMMRLSTMRNEVAENAFKQLFPEPVRKRHY